MESMEGMALEAECHPKVPLKIDSPAKTILI
jgi:hypothetical protein